MAFSHFPTCDIKRGATLLNLLSKTLNLRIAGGANGLYTRHSWSGDPVPLRHSNVRIAFSVENEYVYAENFHLYDKLKFSAKRLILKQTLMLNDCRLF